MTKLIKTVAMAVAGAAALAGCVSPVAGPSGNYASPIGNAPVTTNPTPYSTALVCVGNYARAHKVAPPRVAVGRILDYTGKADVEGGRKVTQGASLMAISAFAKAGARLVERFDTSVTELELKYANNKLIGDGTDKDFRRIHAGSIPGSDFYLVGGITELNYNIRSVGFDAFVGDIDAFDPKGNIGAKLYVINVITYCYLFDLVHFSSAYNTSFITGKCHTTQKNERFLRATAAMIDGLNSNRDSNSNTMKSRIGS